MIAPAQATTNSAFHLVELLIGLLEYRDPHYRSGSSLTRIVAEALGTELRLPPAEIQALTLAAALRDISRLINPVGFDPAKGSTPDAEALREIHAQVHTTLAMLNSVELPPLVMETIRHHHERWDGTGYPDGLWQDSIPPLARVLSVADAFAAILSPRPHRPPTRVRAAVDELLAGAGQQHDPEIVQVLARLVSLGDSGPLAFLEHRRVLVLHPHRQQGDLLAARIGSYGYLAETALTPAEASATLKRSPVSVLVIAADLPNVDPAALIRGLRQSEHFGDLVIVAIRVQRAQDRISLLDAGADGCYVDDIAAEELRAILSSFHRRCGRASSSPWATDPRSPSWHVLEGDLRSFPVAWLLQALRYDGRTATVRTQSVLGERGMIVLEQGELRHAEAGSTAGEEALRTILRWAEGRFEVRLDDGAAVERTIQVPLMDILLTDAIATDHEILGAVRV